MSDYRRPLTEAEIARAREVFGDSIQWERVRITKDTVWSTGAPRALGHTIHLWYSHFQADGETLSDVGPGCGWCTLIHELVHVWQFERRCWWCAASSLWCQFRAWWKQGTRNAAYRWKVPYLKNIPWGKWTAEEQAESIKEWYWKTVMNGVTSAPLDFVGYAIRSVFKRGA